MQFLFIVVILRKMRRTSITFYTELIIFLLCAAVSKGEYIYPNLGGAIRSIPLGTRRKLNLDKTFRRSGRFSENFTYVQFTSCLHGDHVKSKYNKKCRKKFTKNPYNSL